MADPTLVQGARPQPFGTPHVLALAVVDGLDLHAIHRIAAAETTVGRGVEADFALSDPSVSKRHVVILVDGTVYTLIDLESLNGTFLNDRRVSAGGRERLKPLDEIRIGDSRILFTASRFRVG